MLRVLRLLRERCIILLDLEGLSLERLISVVLTRFEATSRYSVLHVFTWREPGSQLRIIEPVEMLQMLNQVVLSLEILLAVFATKASGQIQEILDVSSEGISLCEHLTTLTDEWFFTSNRMLAGMCGLSVPVACMYRVEGHQTAQLIT